MTYEEQISAILDMRSPIRESISAIIKTWEQASESLDEFQQYCAKIRDQQYIPDEIKIAINRFDDKFLELKESIQEELRTLRRASRRFSRTTINIGIAGPARQGKSRFLQRITGLDDTQIPTSKTGFCTVTRSNIRHSHDAYAIVHFYDRKEFMDQIILPHFHEMGVTRNIPTTLDDFWVNPLPKITTDDSKKNKFTNDLFKLHASADSYRRLIGETAIKVDLNDLSQYVSRTNTSFYHAVKLAEIFVPFPMNQFNKFVLTDLPGLGELTAGAKDSLIRSLYDVDLVIMLRRPDNTGDDWRDYDYENLNIIKGAVPEIPPHRWIFIVLNKLDDKSNLQQLIYMLDQARNSEFGAYQILTVNADSQESVHTEAISPILRYLSLNLASLDQEYLTYISNIRFKTRSKLQSVFIDSSTQIQNEYLDMQERPLFEARFNELYSSIIERIEDLIFKYGQYSTEVQTEDEIGNIVDDIYNQSVKDVPLPSLEGIIQQRNIEGSWNVTYDHGLHHCRTMITERLSNINTFLVEEVERLQAQVLDAFSQAGFDKIIPDFTLDTFYSYLNERQYRRIAEALKSFKDTRISYESLYHYLVREEMWALTPDHPKQKELFPFHQDIGFRKKTEDAEHVRKLLRIAYQSVFFQASKKLKQIRTHYKKALFAVVEQFFDDTFRTKQSLAEWDRFVFSNRKVIWDDLFSVLSVQNEYVSQWNDKIDKTLSVINKLL